jgi:hypothetical protein
MISGVIPGTDPRAVWLFAAKSPISAGSEDGGRPRGKTAPAILGPKFDENFAVKMALSAWN